MSQIIDIAKFIGICIMLCIIWLVWIGAPSCEKSRDWSCEECNYGKLHYQTKLQKISPLDFEKQQALQRAVNEIYGKYCRECNSYSTQCPKL